MAKNLSNSKHTFYDENGCKKCGAIKTRRYVSDLICVGCHARMEFDTTLPRSNAQALERNEKYYYPGKHCTRGGHFVKLRVNGSDRRCMECTPFKETRGRTVDSARIDRLYPDLILSKKHAIIFGSAVYRTGKPCPKDHTGWRYVVDGKCIECDRDRHRLKFHQGRPI